MIAHLRLALVLLPLGLLLSPGCNRNNSPNTGIIVEITSDLRVPDEIDQVHLTTKNSQGNIIYEYTYDLGKGANQFMLPFRAGLYPLQDTSAPIHIEAVGQLSSVGQPVVSRSATLSFVTGKKVVLELPLLAVCKNVSCKVAYSTCQASGKCDSDTVDSTTLPEYVPNQPVPATDAATQIPDAQTPVLLTDGPVDAVSDRAPAPDSNPNAAADRALDLAMDATVARDAFAATGGAGGLDGPSGTGGADAPSRTADAFGGISGTGGTIGSGGAPGTGGSAAPAKLVISPTTGSTAAITGKSSTIAFTVANSGDVKTGTITAAINPANPEFAISSTTCAVGLQPLGTCTVSVTFQPSTDGTKHATLVVTDAGAPATPASATVTGVATGPSDLTIIGGPDLGIVALGGTGTPVTFTITNTGGTDATGLVVTSNNTAFVLGNDDCTGQTLAKTTGSCTVTLTFAPPATGVPGAYSGLLTASSTGGNPFNLPVTATATMPAALTITPNPLSFDGIPLNTQSGDERLIITNTGGASTGALTVPSSLGNGFVISGNACSASLLPTQSCVMTIRYTPAVTTQVTWTFTVTSTSVAAGTAQLTGTGKQPTVLSLSPNDVKGCGESPTTSPCFADTAMGQADGSFPKVPAAATAPVTFTITNTNTGGGINLESGAVTVTLGGIDPSDFVMASNNCGPSLQPGQTCTCVVSFKPTTPGLRTATISVTTANGGNVDTSIEGIGLAPIEIQPCGYSDSSTAGIAPTTVTLGTGAEQACISKLATSTTDAADRTGLAFGQVSLGANCDPMNVKWYLVTVNSSTAADSYNLITAILTEAATPSNFRITNPSTTDACNNRNFDLSTGPAHCWISVQFMPQGAAIGANEAATLSATGASGGTASVNLTGTAVGPLAITPATQDFGTVVVNEAAFTTAALIVSNWSTTNALGPASAALSGPAAGDFRVVLDTCTDYTLTAQSGTTACNSSGTWTCQVAYRFSPTAVGLRAATLTITAGAVTSTATLTGTAVAETTITSAPATLPFGGIVLSNKSDYQTVTVTAGAGGVETGTIEFGIVAGPQSDQFEIATGLDAGTCGVTDSVRLGGSNPMSCTVKVRYVPTVDTGLGAAKALLAIVDPRDRTLTQKITLTGTGLTQLTISPTSADFGMVAATENVATTITFTVTNIGTASIVDPTLTVVGPDFTQDAATTCSNGAGSIAGNNGTCLVVVRLGTHATPKMISVTPGVLVTGASGVNESTAAATLSATVQADADLQLVGLAGATATAPPFGTTINMGSVAINGTGQTVTLLYRNAGGHTTTPITACFYDKTGVKLEPGVNDTNYSLATTDLSADNCVGATLAGGQHCKVQINFNPKAAGDLSAGFQLSATIGGTTAGVGFIGHGIDTTASTEKLFISPSFASLIGSPVPTGLSMTTPIPFTVQNNDTAAVALSIGFTGPFQQVAPPSGKTGCSGNLVAGGNCIVWVNFFPIDATPTTDIDFNLGSVTITSTEVATHSEPAPSVTSLASFTSYSGLMGKVRSGTVLKVWNVYAAPGIDYGSVARHLASAAMPFTVMNIGDAPTSGNTTVQILGGGTAPPTSQFSVTGCGTALAAFNISSPSTAATCPAQAIFTPSISGVALVPTPASTIQVEAVATGTQWGGGADSPGSDILGLSGDLYGTCINPASLGITPTGTMMIHGDTASDSTPVAITSAEVLFTLTNGAAVSTLAPKPDFQSTTPITISLTDSTNFLLDLDPAGAGVPTCQVSEDQVTGNLVLVGNQQCAVGVYFIPQAMPASGAAFTTTLTATATTGGSPAVTINATGRDDLSVTSPTTATVAFGSVPVGSVSTTATAITIQDYPGALPTGVLATTVTGPFFVESDTCVGTSVSGGQTCIVSLQFAPTSAGAQTGKLLVSGTPGGTASIGLTGTGG